MCLSIGMNLSLYKSEANLDREDDRFHSKSIESKNTFYRYPLIKMPDSESRLWILDPTHLILDLPMLPL